MMALKEAILGSPGKFGSTEIGREFSINFITSHEGMTLNDLSVTTTSTISKTVKKTRMAIILSSHSIAGLKVRLKMQKSWNYDEGKLG